MHSSTPLLPVSPRYLLIEQDQREPSDIFQTTAFLKLSSIYFQISWRRFFRCGRNLLFLVLQVNITHIHRGVPDPINKILWRLGRRSTSWGGGTALSDQDVGVTRSASYLDSRKRFHASPVGGREFFWVRWKVRMMIRCCRLCQHGTFILVLPFTVRVKKKNQMSYEKNSRFCQPWDDRL